MWKAGLPILAKNSDKSKMLKEQFLKITYLVSALSTTSMAAVFVIATKHIAELFGSSWNGIELYVSILSVVGWLVPLYAVNSIYHQSLARTKIMFKFACLRLLCTLLPIYFLTTLFGPPGLVLSLAFGLVITISSMFIVVCKELNFKITTLSHEIIVSLIPAIFIIFVNMILQVNSLLNSVILIALLIIFTFTLSLKKIKILLKFNKVQIDG